MTKLKLINNIVKLFLTSVVLILGMVVLFI